MFVCMNIIFLEPIQTDNATTDIYALVLVQWMRRVEYRSARAIETWIEAIWNVKFSSFEILVAAKQLYTK